MREETQSQKTICVFCNKPITKKQRPAVQIQPGKQAHMECWTKRNEEARKPN